MNRLMSSTIEKTMMIYSSLMGRLSDLSVPPPIMTPLLKLYSQVYHVNIEELPKPLQEFTSFRDFFTRPMKDGSRIVDARPETIVSPVDGVILETGPMDNPVPSTFRIKGRFYTLEEMLGRLAYVDFPRESMKGLYALFYLNPGSYHRIHAPVTGKITSMSFEPGTLYPVNKLGMRWMPDVHVKNSRVVLKLHGEGDSVQIFLVLIGALVVGNITLSFGGRKTFSAGGGEYFETLSPACPVTRGMEIGIFNLGSSVLMLCYGPKDADMSLVAEEGPVLMGSAVIDTAALQAKP